MINMLIEIIGGILTAVLDMIGSLLTAIFSSGHSRKHELDADFMPASKLLSRWNKGFSLNGRLHLPLSSSYMSALILGGSGSGKTTTICVPSIYNLAKHGHNIIIHDPSGELLRILSMILRFFGYTIKVIHYADPSISDGFNPIARANDESSIQKVASLLIRNALGESNKDPFWQLQSVLLLSLIMRILKKQNPWYQTPANVLYILNCMTTKPEAVDILVLKCNDPHILNDYKQFQAMDRKLYTSISATCRAALSIFSDPAVQKITAFDTVDFESFKKGEKTALFILNKTGDARYYSSLSAIYFEQFFSFLMDRLPEKGDRSIFFILDECSSLYLPSLPIALANLRKFGSGIMLLAQEYSQLVHLYGSYEAEAIKSNCYSKVYYAGAPLSTCQELERLLGTFEYQDEQGNRRTRPLMTADEIRTMDADTALILAGAKRAIHTRMYPYYRNRKFQRASRLPEPELKSKIPFEELPLIPLPTKPK